MGRRVKIVCLNDVYTFTSGDLGHGGFAAAQTMIKELREDCKAKGVDMVTVLAGDFLGGSSLVEHFRGATAIDVMNVMNFDALVIGNHEFDFGWKRLEELAERSTTPLWLGANVLKTTESGKSLLAGVKDFDVIVTDSGIRVGMFGVCTQATPSMSHPGEGVEFTSVTSATKDCLAELKKENVDLIVALTHLSSVEDKALLRQFPEIDIVVGGHDHDPLAVMINDKLVFKCGQNAYWLGTVDVTLEDGEKKPSFSWHMESTRGVEDDPECVSIVERYRVQKEAEFEAETGDLNQVMCEVLAPLETRTAVVRRREASAGNLIADALLDYYQNAQVDMAIINGGFIRGNKVYAAGTKLTRRDVLEELPFPRVSTCIQILGRHLLEAVEQELRLLPEPGGLFPHFSKTAKVVFDSSSPPLERIKSFEIKGKPVEADKTYRVALTEFMAAGGDGCSSFGYGKSVGEESGIPGVRISSVLLKYLENNPRITPGVFGRSKDLAHD